MATVSIQATAICAGGGHVTITASVNGGASRVKRWELDELRQAIAGTEADDVILSLIRLHSIGKTANQLKNDLQAGITVTV